MTAREAAIKDKCLTITVPEAAGQIGVSPDTIVRWAESGCFPVFVPPGRDLGDSRRGPKGLMIWVADWEAFLRSRTQTGVSPDDPKAPKKPIPLSAVPVGLDGVSRLGGGRRA
jgi:hypothetical protein